MGAFPAIKLIPNLWTLPDHTFQCGKFGCLVRKSLFFLAAHPVKPFSKELAYRVLRVAKPADFWQDRRTFWNQVGPQCGSPVHLSFPESSRRAMLRDRHWRRAARQRGSSAPGGRALPSVGQGKSPAQSACVRAGGLRRCAPFKSWPRVGMRSLARAAPDSPPGRQKGPGPWAVKAL